jgi:hypothetical protein
MVKRVRSQLFESWNTHKLFEDHIIWETNNSYVNLHRLLCEKPQSVKFRNPTQWDLSMVGGALRNHCEMNL